MPYCLSLSIPDKCIPECQLAHEAWKIHKLFNFPFSILHFYLRHVLSFLLSNKAGSIAPNRSAQPRIVNALPALWSVNISVWQWLYPGQICLGNWSKSLGFTQSRVMAAPRGYWARRMSNKLRTCEGGKGQKEK
jgi:hypothetical protein